MYMTLVFLIKKNSVSEDYISVVMFFFNTQIPLLGIWNKFPKDFFLVCHFVTIFCQVLKMYSTA